MVNTTLMLNKMIVMANQRAMARHKEVTANSREPMASSNHRVDMAALKHSSKAAVIMQIQSRDRATETMVRSSASLQISLIYNLEMSNMNGGRSTDPNFILNETREIDRGIDAIEANLDRLRGLQSRYLNDTDASSNSPVRRELDSMSAETMTLYRSFVGRIKNIKSNPESGAPRNKPQVGKVDRRLKKAIEQYQQVDRDFRRNLTSQMERQYRIVRPDATDAEVREAVEDTDNQQVFSQAVRQMLLLFRIQTNIATAYIERSQRPSTARGAGGSWSSPGYSEN